MLSIFVNMKLTLQIQLLPDVATGQKLKATVARFNEAANYLASKAYERTLANKFALQKLYYSDLRRQFGLSAQMAIRCIAQVVEAFKRDKTVQPSFRPTAAMPYDQRLYSFKGIDRVSLLTLEGRVLVPMLMGNYQREQFGYAKGQADLVLRKDGKWFLLVSVDVPDGTPIPTTDFIGVDLGTTNLAVTDDGETYRGDTVENVRQKMHDVRKAIDTPRHPSDAKCVVTKTMLTATPLGTSEQGLCVNKPKVSPYPQWWCQPPGESCGRDKPTGFSRGWLTPSCVKRNFFFSIPPAYPVR